MIRRIAAAAAAAVALILVPSAAMAFNAPMAYNAPGYTCTLSDPTPAVGAAVKLVCTGAPAGQVLTLKVTRNPAANFGTKVFTATANAGGVATFSFTLAPAGDYSFEVQGVNGAVVSTQTVKVVGPAAAPIRAGQLSRTGFDVMPIAAGGGLLVLAGAGAVLVARRRKSSQVSA